MPGACRFSAGASVFNLLLSYTRELPLHIWKRKPLYLEGGAACIYSTNTCEVIGTLLEVWGKNYKQTFLVTLGDAKDVSDVVFYVSALRSTGI